MKLFLTSQANQVIDKIVEFLSKKPEDLELVYITTASNMHEDKSWVQSNMQDFKIAGFKVKEFDIAGRNKDQLREELKDVEIVLVDGGETYYLLDQVRKSGFDEVVKELVARDVVYIGSSAGSIIIGPDIDIARRYDNPDLAPDLSNFKGLSLIDLVIVPHCNSKMVKGFLELTIKDFKDKPHKLLLLNDNQFLKVVDNTYEVITK